MVRRHVGRGRRGIAPRRRAVDDGRAAGLAPGDPSAVGPYRGSPGSDDEDLDHGDIRPTTVELKELTGRRRGQDRPSLDRDGRWPPRQVHGEPPRRLCGGARDAPGGRGLPPHSRRDPYGAGRRLEGAGGGGAGGVETAGESDVRGRPDYTSSIGLSRAQRIEICEHAEEVALGPALERVGSLAYRVEQVIDHLERGVD